MIIEGIPWLIVLPIACLALAAGVMSSKKEIETAKKLRSVKKKKK